MKYIINVFSKIAHDYENLQTLPFLFVTILAFAPQAYSQSVRETFQQHILEQLVLYPQQKLHLHLDKPSHIAGEKAWFRAHLVDAALHTPFAAEGLYVYTELINPLDSVVARVMIRPVDGIYSGYLPILEILPEGDYTVCAYTKNFINQGAEYFYRRTIKILSPYSNKVRLDVSFKIDGTKVQAKVNLLLKLTHGWRRYTISYVLKGVYEHPTTELKPGMEIKGNIRDLISNRPKKKGRISVFNRIAGYLDEISFRRLPEQGVIS